MAIRVLLCSLMLALGVAVSPLAGLSAQELTVTGQLDPAIAPDGSVVLTIEALKALPVAIIRTSTPWTTGMQEFTGVSLADLARTTGMQGAALTATALNDYAVTFPVQDAISAGAIVAYQLNGEAMSVREKGPYWIIFPYDDLTDASIDIRAWSAWQLATLTSASTP